MTRLRSDMSWHPRFVTILTTVVVGCALAACGGDDDVVEASEPVETVKTGSSTEHTDDNSELQHVPEPEPTSGPTLEELSAEVVRAIRSMMVIDTASHSVETMIEREAEGRFFSSDKIQLIAYGSVIAGVDLVDVSDADVEVIDSETVRVTLPESTILRAELDRNRTHVTLRDTGILGSESEELEAEAIAEAEVKILQSACEHNILERASADAEKHVVTALQSLGYTAISVDAPVGTCQ